MSTITDEGGALTPSPGAADTGLDIAAAISSVVPWLGGPVSNVLSGLVRDRKIRRVHEALAGLAKELWEFRSEASEAYVKTEEFEDLLEQTLHRVADERSGAKRELYRAFLRGAIKSPGDPYDEQLRVLRMLELLQPDHVRVLRAMMEPPDPNPPPGGSHDQCLAKRAPEISSDRRAELSRELTDLRLVDLSSSSTMMTGRGAEDLSGQITPYGRRFLEFLAR